MKTCARCQTPKALTSFVYLPSSGRHHSYCDDCRKQYAKDRRKAGKTEPPRDQRARRLRLRDEAYDHYGGECACCGETEYLFLTLDHVNNDGVEHRKRYKGLPMYVVAKREGYPDTFQLLCFNCNCGRARNGGVCPHQLQ